MKNNRKFVTTTLFVGADDYSQKIGKLRIDLEYLPLFVDFFRNNGIRISINPKLLK